jgi:uncharacterized protein (TIGR03790 family)
MKRLTSIDMATAARRGLSVLALLAVLPATTRAQSAANVLLVVNDADLSSVEIGEHYAKARALPVNHVVHIKPPVLDVMTRLEYERTIEGPLGQWIAKHRLQDQVLYIVLTKGIPLRIAGTTGREGSTASVDSELTLLYRKLVGTASPTSGRVPNPYYLGENPLDSSKPFARATSDIYLVTRLDGFTVADVKALIDRGVAPSQSGRIVLDVRATLPDRTGDSWLEQTAASIAKVDAARVLLESTRARASSADKALGYFSWGSNDAAIRDRKVGLSFEPGAIGGMFVSTDGRTFREPPAEWKPVDSPLRDPMFGPNSQSLAGDLIREGISGVSANVAEPFLDGMVRPQILFPSYLSGRNLAEAFYLAMPFLSWQGIVVGDPLCAPFAAPLSAGSVEPADPTTGLPRHFSQRRLAALARTGGTPEALALMLKVENALAVDPAANVEATLLEAIKLDPKFQTTNLLLATTYEAQQQYDKAIAVYRRMLQDNPNHPIVMNNLAYTLAVQKNELKEAQELAEKALLMVRNPLIADTLGWIHHLTGDDRKAVSLLEYAAAGAPDNVEVLVHLATVYADLGDKLRARNVVDLVLKISAAASERAEIKALQAKIK